MQGSFARLAHRAKLLAPSPASTLASTNLHLIISGQLVQAGFFVSFPTAKSLCVHERSGAVGFDLRDSFPLSFSSVLFFSSSSFLSHSASGFSLPLSCSCLVCPAAASSTALQALYSTATATRNTRTLASHRLDLFPASFDAPLEAPLFVWSFCPRRPWFSELVFGASSLHPPLRPLLSPDFSSPSSPPTAATPCAPPSPASLCAPDPVSDAESVQSQQWPTLALSRPLRSLWAPLPPKMARATQLTSPRLLFIFRRIRTQSRRPSHPPALALMAVASSRPPLASDELRPSLTSGPSTLAAWISE